MRSAPWRFLNLRRVGRLAREWMRYYRSRAFWSREENWATDDFLTRGELRALCRHGHFAEVMAIEACRSAVGPR